VRGIGIVKATSPGTALGSIAAVAALTLALASPATAAVRHLPLGPFGSAAQPSLTAPTGLAVDAVSGELYAIDAGRSEVQSVTVAASAGKFKLKYEAASTVELNFNANEFEVEPALRNAVCGGSNCLILKGAGPGGTSPYTVSFRGALSGSDVPQLECEDGTPPLSGGAGCSVETTTNGIDGGLDRYHADGSEAQFSSLGGNTIDGRGPEADETPQGMMAWAAGPIGVKLSQVALAPAGAAGGTEHDIYVTQNYSKVVDVFGPNGDYLGQLSEFKQGANGTGALKGFNEPCGVGADGSGNVYVGDFSNEDLIHKYHPSSNPVANTDTTANLNGLLGTSSPCAVAAGAGPTNGYLFVNRVNGELFKVDASTGEVKYQVNTSVNTTVTVDASSGHVFAATGNEVREYDATGASEAKLVSTTTVPNAPGAVTGVAAKEGKIYLSRAGKSQIEAFGPLVALPDVATVSADEFGPTSATLHGTISAAGGPDATCHFEYTTEEAFEADSEIEGHDGFAGAESAPCAPSGPFSGEATNAVSAQASGLQEETAYEYRLVGENENGPIAAPEREMETPGVVLLKGGVAGEVTATGALVFGEANPHGLPSSVAVQYVTQARFAESGYEGASTTPARALPATVSGTGDLSAGTGTGDLSAAKGAGTLSEESSQVTGVSTSLGEFAVGQSIEGTGIAPGTTILAVAGTKLTISVPAIASGEVALKAGSKTVANLATATGAFAPGQEITGTGIAAGTSVIAVGAGTLTLSKPAVAPGAAVALKAASKTIAGVVTLAGTFAPGQVIEGAGIVPGTTIAAVGEGTLTLSAAVSEAGQGVALSASGYQPVSEAIAGLQPETAYRFRLIGENEAGDSVEEPDHAFSTFGEAGAGLPDGRAYELVSPAQKLGEVFPPNPLSGTCGAFCIPGASRQKMPMAARPDGGAMAYQGAPFTGGLASGGNEYVAERSPSGWTTSALSELAFRDSENQGFKAFSEDLSVGVLYQIEPSLTEAAPANFANLYRWSEGGALEALNLTVPPERDPGRIGANKFVVTYAGANAGSGAVAAFSHVVFQANDQLTEEVAGIAPQAPAVGAGETDVYEWSGGRLRLVNVAPHNASAIANAVVGSGLEDFGGGSSNFNFEHAISADGSRIFWSAPSGQVYVREDATSTIEVPDPGRFVNAAVNGSKVLLSDGKVYDLQAETLTDLTGGQGGFQGSLGASEDLSRIYFVDTKVLSGEEANENGEAAEAGAFNLYLAEAGTTTFIGRLSAQDNNEGGTGTWHAPAGTRTAQVSADGRYAAFNSAAALTGFDNRHAGGGGCVEGGGSLECKEVFAYDAQSGKLRCASCNPSGARPIGASSLSLLNGHKEAFPQPHNLPSQGEGRLFFESQDTLAADDANGHIQDVYEWRPEGVGGCGRALGCIGLISSGRSPYDSQFVNATPSGADAFFTTREALVPQDVDDFVDLYDARVGGGIPYNPPVPCEGEACRGPAAAAPSSQSPASSTFAGPGNPKPRPRCKKRFVRRHGRCVKRHARRHKHKRRHKHRRAHAKRGAAR
jgi:hypothetical protein